MEEFWNTRYAEKMYAYGIEPNAYLKSIIAKLNLSGKILFPAEGEGRNAVYAAKIGFDVTAFDLSVEGKNKALKLAKEKGVELNYLVGSLNDLNFKENSFDVIVLIYAHFPPSLRIEIHQKLSHLLKPGGHLIIEGFSKKHIAYQKVNPKVGGPKNIEMLFSEEELASDFKSLKTQFLKEEEILLDEGLYHQGLANVIRYIGKK